MTNLESLIHIIGNVSRPERKLVRHYLSARSPNGQHPNKMLKLFDLLIEDQKREWTVAGLEKRLDLQRHHAAFGRLVTHLRRRIIEALSLPVVTAFTEEYSERTKAMFHYHRQYLKALILFEAGDYASADETLLSLIFWTEKYELYAERLATAEFLMRTIRIYSQPESLKYFIDIPDQSRRILSVISSAENIREMIDSGAYKEAQIEFTLLNECLNGASSRHALFVMKGIQAKAAALQGKYKNAEKLFFEQLGCCNHDAVRSEENRAHVYVDIAQNFSDRKKNYLAREYIDMALRCKRMYKSTSAKLEQLQSDLQSESKPNQ